MSAFTDALSAFIAADRKHAALVEKERQWMQIPAVALAVETSAQVLAQAGDVLEQELSEMVWRATERALTNNAYRLLPPVILPHGGILGEP